MGLNGNDLSTILSPLNHESSTISNEISARSQNCSKNLVEEKLPNSG